MNDMPEKLESDTNFDLLYIEVVKMVQEGNHAFSLIPQQIKNKFLNFYNLLPFEQVDLIAALSTIKGLPNEMTTLINQFPYFDIIPDNGDKQSFAYEQVMDELTQYLVDLITSIGVRVSIVSDEWRTSPALEIDYQARLSSWLKMQSNVIPEN